MPVTLTEFGRHVNRFRQGGVGIMPRMAKEKEPADVNLLLWRNVSALMEYRWQETNLSRLGRETGIELGGATRLRDGKNIGVRLIQRIAKHFKVEPWQLFRPDFDPATATIHQVPDEAFRQLLEICPRLTPKQRTRLLELAQDFDESNGEQRRLASEG